MSVADLETVLETLAKFLKPVFQSASRNEISNSVWQPDGPGEIGGQ